MREMREMRKMRGAARSGDGSWSVASLGRWGVGGGGRAGGREGREGRIAADRGGGIALSAKAAAAKELLHLRVSSDCRSAVGRYSAAGGSCGVEGRGEGEGREGRIAVA
jgi:hypothetical protein